MRRRPAWWLVPVGALGSAILFPFHRTELTARKQEQHHHDAAQAGKGEHRRGLRGGWFGRRLRLRADDRRLVSRLRTATGAQTVAEQHARRFDATGGFPETN